EGAEALDLVDVALDPARARVVGVVAEAHFALGGELLLEGVEARAPAVEAADDGGVAEEALPAPRRAELAVDDGARGLLGGRRRRLLGDGRRALGLGGRHEGDRVRAGVGVGWGAGGVGPRHLAEGEVL